jgi:hypothetical protein
MLIGMGRPSYDEETLAAYFHPASDDIFEVPVVGPVLRRLTVEDPDIMAAVADVDRSQIRDCLRLAPWERLSRALGMIETLTSFHRVL